MNEGRLMAHLDGELPGELDRRVAQHLAACEACRERLRGLREASALVGRALSALDVPVPDRDPDSVRGAAAGRATAGSGRGWRSVARRGLLLKVAMLVLAVGTAAAAVIPGSPLRRWVVDTVGPWIAGPPSDTVATAAAPPAPSPESVSIPVGDRAVVQIVDPGPGLAVRVRVVDGRRLTVSGRAGRWETGPGSVEVAGAVGAELLVEMPGTVTSARISADDRLLLEHERGRLRLHAPADTIEDGFLIRLGRAGAGR